ncbi:MAG: selenocysteine-specific translation elongation factor [Nitrospirota bacterium]
MKSIILGTAGHIDHGKSSLVKALTGIDPDRWKEEKERGITLDLGFAFLDLPDNNRLGIVDVPGHEGLIKNMLAGVGGIDMVLLVIAADEGVMPQTREHLAICDLLQIKKGIIALTKIDMVDQDWLALVRNDVRAFVKGTFLETAPLIPVSSKTGENLSLLVKELSTLANKISPRSSNSILRLPIDRVFTIKGFGTVVTGTLLSGTINTEQEVEIFPKGIPAKVRGIQSHNQTVSQAIAGQRTAVNLQSIEKDRLSRGDTLVSTGFFKPTTTLDAKLVLLKQSRTIKTGTRIRFYNTTQEALGRIIVHGNSDLGPGQEAYVRFQLEQPVVVQHGDRYILRFLSPMETLGGGMVLNSHPQKNSKYSSDEFLATLKNLETGDREKQLALLIQDKGFDGIEHDQTYGIIAAEKSEIANALAALVKKGILLRINTQYIHASQMLPLEKEIIDRVSIHHQNNPLQPGIDKEAIKSLLEIRASDALLSMVIENLIRMKRLAMEGCFLKLSGFKPAKDHESLKRKIIEAIKQGGNQPPLREEFPGLLSVSEKEIRDMFKLITNDDQITRINDSLYMVSDIVESIKSALKKYLEEKKDISMSEFRDLAKTSRKFAVPLMEYFDSQKLTQRVGDKRVLRG